MNKLIVLLVSGVYALGQQVPPKAPFTITITAEHPTVKAGADVWIKVSIENHSKQSIDDSGGVSDRTGLDPNLHFEVRDEAGKLVPKRVYPHPEMDTGSPLNRTIAPGETLMVDQRPSTLYDMSKPRKYVIQVSRRASDDLKGGEIKSNTVIVTVVQ